MVTRRNAIVLGASGIFAGAMGSLLPSNGLSARQKGPEQFPGLTSWLEAQRVGWGVPGLSVAMIRDGRVVYINGFGHRDRAGTKPVTIDTLFRGASTTKALGAASVAALVDDGKLNWTDPVTKWLPELRLKGGDQYREITLVDMLNHRTGLPRHDLVWYNNTKLTREGLLARMPHLEMSAPLRERYQYNNLMYILAGLAVERVSGQTWEAFTKARFLEPLGMRTATLSALEMGQVADHAIGHASDGNGQTQAVPLRHDGLLGPAGALCASIKDYAQWVMMLLDRGTLAGTKVLSPAAIAALWEPRLLTSGTPKEPEFDRGYYGLGWRIDRYRDKVRIAHGGDLNGFTSRVVMLPQINAGLVVLVNHGGHPLPNAVTPDLLDRLLGLPLGDNAAKALDRRRGAPARPPEPEKAAENPEPIGPPSRALALFAGNYRHAGYGDFSISPNSGGLDATYNDMPATLKHRTYDVFETKTDRLEHGDFNGVRLVFQGDDEGKIISFTARLQDEVGPILFERVG